jgi:threonine aldolase
MIDFRSDTVTRPDRRMREAMAHAAVGDDVYGDDPTVNDLEAWAAERHGFEAALFCASGTQANLLALMSHCERGEEYLCGQNAHNYLYEGGGAAVLGSIQPQPIPNEPDGTLCLDKLAGAVKPDDVHYARTRLLSLENTFYGLVLPLDYQTQARAFVDRHGLRLHLDGARAYNAAVALGVDITAVVQPFDSVSICLSKGLGAPVGSLLLASGELVAKARRYRKMLGGGMRQAGILAAAGKMALQENVEHLAEDHANARYLGERLAQLPGFAVDGDRIMTNMVFALVDDAIDMARISSRLAEQDIHVATGSILRLVTHRDIRRADIDHFIDCLRALL